MSYRLLRHLLFQMPAETAHGLAAAALERLLAPPAVRSHVRRRFAVDDPILRVDRWGISFPNPVGLAAGFDKAGTLFNALGALGFGFVEIGTVTALPQPGNPLPRLFRLPNDAALLNRMGFNNPGADAVAERLQQAVIEPVLGINLGKSKATPLDQATSDYLQTLDRLEPFARYIVVNVSSPNTPGLRRLQDAEPLRHLLRAVLRRSVGLARTRDSAPRPLLLKIAPDLSDAQIDEAVNIALDEGVAGIVAVNTTVSREGLRTPAPRVADLGAGGISGSPLRQRARDVISRIYRRTEGRLPIVGVGGVFNAEDAWAHIRAGACLVQLYTGLVYGGPATVRNINRGLVRILRREGLRSLDEAVGSAHH
jgi:dihydroorotate dehydrogenase